MPHLHLAPPADRPGYTTGETLELLGIATYQNFHDWYRRIDAALTQTGREPLPRPHREGRAWIYTPDQLQRLLAVRDETPGTTALLLDDDGIVDEVAIETALSGRRVVAMTASERRIAARRLRDQGHVMTVIARRLGTTTKQARLLLNATRAAVEVTDAAA